MQPVEMDDEEYVDVRSLPLRPPQPLVLPGRPTRRCWHPVMWDDSITGEAPPAEAEETDEEREKRMTREYPHKQRIRNLRKLIANGTVKPTPETLIFFLCNKFAVSDERKTKMKAQNN